MEVALSPHQIVASLATVVLLLWSAPSFGQTTGPPPDAAKAEVDIEIQSAPPKDRPAEPPPTPAASAAEVAELRAQVAQLAARLAAPPPPAPPTTPVQPAAPALASILSLPVYTTTARPDSGTVLDPVGVVLSGFTQLQYVSSQISEDQLQQGGEPVNRDGFALRLARLRVDGSWRWARFTFEVSGNTLHGPYLGVLRAEAALLWRNPRPGAPPYVMLTGGLQEMPFGNELPESVRRRPFMERTRGSQALFPGSTDLGLRLSGGVSYLRYGLAVTNGVPLVEQAGAAYTVATQSKDVLGRLGFDTTRSPRSFAVSGGVSFLAGTGFHAGTSAAGSTTQWRDSNENGLIDAGELVGVPARSATPSTTFARWAVGADLQGRLSTRIGWTQVYGEVTIATNLDRGLFPADPVSAGYDLRHLAAHVAFTQQIFQFGIVGFRWDVYNPDADFSENRRGQRIPGDASIHTLSPLVGVNAFEHLRLLAQYDVIFDTLARDPSGVPTDLANNQLTIRLQGDF
jgi:hypothetical protein